MKKQHEVVRVGRTWPIASAAWGAAVLATTAFLFGGAAPAQEANSDLGGKKGRVERITGKKEAAAGKSDAKRKYLTLRIDRLQVAETPLKQILDHLSNLTGMNISVKRKKDENLPVTFHLENVTPRALLDFIAKKYGLIVDDEQMDDGIIIIESPQRVEMFFNNEDVRHAIDMIAQMADLNVVVGPEVTGTVTAKLKDVPWNVALDTIVKALDFVVVPEKGGVLRITTPDKILRQLDTRIFRLAYISPEMTKYSAVLSSEFVERKSSKKGDDAGKSLIDVLDKIKSPVGKIAYQKGQNALVLIDTPNKLNVAQEIINKLDKAPKQIYVNVKMVELSDNDVEAMGINWSQGLQFAMSPMSQWTTAFPFDVSNGLSRSGFLGDTAVALGGRRGISPVDGSIVTSADIFSLRRAVQQGLDLGGKVSSFPGSPGALSFGSMGFAQTTALFEMFRTQTSGRIIQAPQLVALDHEEATIQVGELVRYAESYIASTEGGGMVSGFREASNSPIKLGLQLLIIPQVTGPENNILMTIVPKTENFSLQRSGTGGAPAGFQRFIGPDGIQLDLPQTNQRIVVTKMLLRNGETGVIGGLREESDTTSEVKVPVLGDIPFLGRLFKHRRRDVSGTNLLVFVTPTIHDIELRDDFRKQLERLKDEYSKPFTTIGIEEAAEKSRTDKEEAGNMATMP